MSDRTPEAADPKSAPLNEPADPSRRKLAGALGATAVFTLSSRPVWANQCSISGMASGNLSAPQGVTCEGCTPGYWKQCQHLDSWAATGFMPTDTFNSVFQVSQYVDCKGTPYTLLDVLCLNGNSYSCSLDPAKSNKDANPSGPPPRCNNGNAFCDLGGDPISENLGFHAVGALLNAGHPNVNFGYTPGELIEVFKKNLHRPAELKDSLAMLNERGCPLN